MTRRTFLAAAAAAPVASSQTKPMTTKLGIDVFSVRSQGWTAEQYIDYCKKLGAGVVHLSETRFLGSLDEASVRKVKAHADAQGVSLEVGMRSICPSSKAFDAKQGTAEEQIARMLSVAKWAGSPIVRCFLGTSADRVGTMPIEGHIESTVRVLRGMRSRIEDAKIRIAIENHAGDMQGRELKMLIDEAGREFVGVCLDSGNPLWTIEDPHVTLETLAPYVLTSHVRDSAVWRVPEGAAVAWTRVGEGNVGIERWVRRYQELCPGKPVSLEVIVLAPRTFAYLQPGFWDGYRNVRAHEFARFLALAEAGKPKAFTAAPKEMQAQREREDLEASVEAVKGWLG